jgi:hypothetical protein
VAGQHQHQGAVQQVTATVRLWSGVQRLRGSSTDVDHRDHRDHHAPPGAHADPDKLHVRVRLSALLKDGATSCGQLIDALAGVGVTVTEQELIDAPLTIELAPEVQAQISENEP